MHVVFGIFLPLALLLSDFYKPFSFDLLLLCCKFLIIFVLQLTLTLFLYFKMAAEKIIRREKETDDLRLFNGKKVIPKFALQCPPSLLWVNQILRFCFYGVGRRLWPSSRGDTSVVNDIFPCKSPKVKNVCLLSQ